MTSVVDLQSMIVSKQKPVKGGVPQGSLLGLILFNAFLNYKDSEKDLTLNKFADDTKLCGQLIYPSEVRPSRETLTNLKVCACANLTLGLTL